MGQGRILMTVPGRIVGLNAAEGIVLEGLKCWMGHRLGLFFKIRIFVKRSLLIAQPTSAPSKNEKHL